MSVYEQEAAPERLSAEWHARESEEWEAECLEILAPMAKGEPRADISAKAEEHRDRAAKLRRLEEVERENAALKRQLARFQEDCDHEWTPILSLGAMFCFECHASMDATEFQRRKYGVGIDSAKEARDGE